MRYGLAAIALLLLTSCAPGLTRVDENDVVLSGPYEGCSVYTLDRLWTIDCPYRAIDWGDPTPGQLPIREGPPSEPAEPPIIVVPDQPTFPGEPVPTPPQPPEEPSTPTDPEQPDEPTDPDVDEPEEEEDEECKPGWGFGDPNHCHAGPPGRR